MQRSVSSYSERRFRSKNGDRYGGIPDPYRQRALYAVLFNAGHPMAPCAYRIRRDLHHSVLLFSARAPYGAHLLELALYLHEHLCHLAVTPRAQAGPPDRGRAAATSAGISTPDAKRNDQVAKDRPLGGSQIGRAHV